MDGGGRVGGQAHTHLVQSVTITRNGELWSTYVVALFEHVDRDQILVDARRRRVDTGELVAAGPTASRLVIRERANFTRAFAAVSAVVVALGLVVVLVAVAVADAVDLG